MPTPTALRDCGQRDNCVSTTHPADDAPRAIAPLAFDGDVVAAKARLRAIVAAMPRTAVVADDGPYLHVTFTTWLFRWTDDVEFLLDAKRKRIDFRSASRVGKGDLGVNRKRMEQIRAAWDAGG